MKSLRTGVAALAFVIHAGGASAAEDILMQQAQKLFKPLPPAAQPSKGAVATPAMVELGKALYFDPRLSESRNISCSTCHEIGLGGADMQPASVGHRWQKGPRNAPTIFNAAVALAPFWDGRAEELKQQAAAAVQNRVEMAITHEHAVEMLQQIPGYQPLFDAAFPDDKGSISMDKVTKAIAAFGATLLTPNAPFDRYLRGDAGALNPDQTAGLQLFIEKGCAACHGGVNVGGSTYAPVAVVERPGADILPLPDRNRFLVTKTPSDEYLFKVPTLRNIELTAPYFHSGRSWDLTQAVAVMATSQLGGTLSDVEVERVVAFLRALTGDQPRVTHPILPPSTSAPPMPGR
jgi:cytochrome c peroxidase